jgi:hypothetical protein
MDLVSDGEDPDAALNNEAELNGDMAELSLGEKLAIASAPPAPVNAGLRLSGRGRKKLNHIKAL